MGNISCIRYGSIASQYFSPLYVNSMDPVPMFNLYLPYLPSPHAKAGRLPFYINDAAAIACAS